MIYTIMRDLSFATNNISLNTNIEVKATDPNLRVRIESNNSSNDL